MIREDCLFVRCDFYSDEDSAYLYQRMYMCKIQKVDISILMYDFED